MGDLWDLLTGRYVRERGEELARQKVPQVRGLSEETMAQLAEEGDEIVDDDPQAQILQDLADSGEWRKRGPATDS